MPSSAMAFDTNTNTHFFRNARIPSPPLHQLNAPDDKEHMTYHSTATSPTHDQDHGFGKDTYLRASGKDATHGTRLNDFSNNKYSTGDVSYRNETWGHGSSFAGTSTGTSLSPPSTSRRRRRTPGGQVINNAFGTSLGHDATLPLKKERTATQRERTYLQSSGSISGSSDKKAARLDFKLPASFIPETNWLLETFPIPTQTSRPHERHERQTILAPAHSSTFANKQQHSLGMTETTTSIISGRDKKFTGIGERYRPLLPNFGVEGSIQFMHPVWPSRSPSSRQETILLRKWFRENLSILELKPSTTHALLHPSMYQLQATSQTEQMHSSLTDSVVDTKANETEEQPVVKGREGPVQSTKYDRIAFHRDENGNVINEEQEAVKEDVCIDNSTLYESFREEETEQNISTRVQQIELQEYKEALQKSCSLRELYAIAFHELSRQVSAHCGERGMFMNELWMKYTNCLDDQLEILKIQRNAAMEREATLLARLHTFDQERAKDEEAIKIDLQRKETEISILQTQLENEIRAKEDLQKDYKSGRKHSEDGTSDHISEHDSQSHSGSRRWSELSLEQPAGRRRRSSLYDMQHVSYQSHEILHLTSQLESAGLRATEYREELDKVQTSYEKMELNILQLESQLAAAEHQAEMAESDRQALQYECERLRDEAKCLTPRPDRALPEEFDDLSEEQIEYTKEVVKATATVKGGPEIAVRILLGRIASELNLDEETFKMFWGVMAKSGTKRRKNRRSYSMTYVKDLLDNNREVDEEIISRYGQDMANMMKKVKLNGETTSDNVVACMMGIIPGLGDSGLIGKECFGCLRNTISEDVLLKGLNFCMRSTIDRINKDEGIIRELQTELSKMVAWKEDIDRENADLLAKKAKYLEIKENTEKTPMDIFLETEWQDMFIGLGVGNNVPKYMRTNSKIRNRNMTKRETEKTVKEIWAEKKAADKKDNTVLELSVFMPHFFQKRVGLPAAVTEIIYNFMFSLKKYDYDADCELFLRIVLGQIKEEVYHEQIKLCGAVEDVFRQIDLASNNEIEKGYIVKEDARLALKAFFNDKSPERMNELLDALDEANSGNKVDYLLLFEEDREFNQGPFAECIRDQFLEERLEQFENLEKALYECTNYESMCTVEQLEEASDRVFGKPLPKSMINASLQGQDSASIQSIMNFLRKGVINKTSDEKETKSKSDLKKTFQTMKAVGKFKKKNSGAVRRVSVAVDSVRQEWMKRELVSAKPLITHRDSTIGGKPLVYGDSRRTTIHHTASSHIDSLPSDLLRQHKLESLSEEDSEIDEKLLHTCEADNYVGGNEDGQEEGKNEQLVSLTEEEEEEDEDVEEEDDKEEQKEQIAMSRGKSDNLQETGPAIYVDQNREDGNIKEDGENNVDSIASEPYE